jgi:hypothetical protein
MVHPSAKDEFDGASAGGFLKTGGEVASGHSNQIAQRLEAEVPGIMKADVFPGLVHFEFDIAGDLVVKGEGNAFLFEEHEGFGKSDFGQPVFGAGVEKMGGDESFEGGDEGRNIVHTNNRPKGRQEFSLAVGLNEEMDFDQFVIGFGISDRTMVLLRADENRVARPNGKPGRIYLDLAFSGDNIRDVESVFMVMEFSIEGCPAGIMVGPLEIKGVEMIGELFPDVFHDHKIVHNIRGFVQRHIQKAG